ncbi:MAG: O-antigen ligase family protein [bacterium]|nr:O-antigen ligase family protein [bacterium]
MRNPFFYRTFLFIVLFELLSIFGYLLPQFNTIAFFFIVALVALVTFWKLEYGCYAILAELFIGSKGFLFFWVVGGTMISLRIALWLVVMSVWCARFLTNKNERDFWRHAIQRPIIRWVFLFFFVILFSAVQGFFRNTPADAFFDANAWLFFLLLFPFLSTLRTKEHFDHTLSILFAAVFSLSLKALAILFIYAHDPLGGVFLPLYRWVRTTGVGEITVLNPTFARIFFQSQIYVLIAFFLLFFLPRSKNIFDRVTRYMLHVVCLASLLLSLSRSFWLAGIVTLSIALLYVREWKKCVEIMSIGVVGFFLIFAVMNFPYPRTAGGSLASLIEDRATETQEAGIGSRWSLLPPLLNRISEHWFLGAGFGTTVTYKSSDPRIVESSARGNNFYTTYAFEWGYLDLLLKFGFLGTLVYCVLLWMIGKRLYLTTDNLPPPLAGSRLPYQSQQVAGQLTTGLFFGFIALLLTNIFSPYLNHPLGIGILLLCIIFSFLDVSHEEGKV